MRATVLGNGTAKGHHGEYHIPLFSFCIILFYTRLLVPLFELGLCCLWGIYPSWASVASGEFRTLIPLIQDRTTGPMSSFGRAEIIPVKDSHTRIKPWALPAATSVI